MDEAAVNEETGKRACSLLTSGMILVLSLPFWLGAVILGWEAVAIEQGVSRMVGAQLCQSTIFLLGLAVGLSGTAVALGGSSDRSRRLGVAGALLGFGFVVLAFVMGWHIDRAAIGSDMSPLPFALPSVLIVAALVTALNAFRDETEEQEDEPAEDQPTEEQQ